MAKRRDADDRRGQGRGQGLGLRLRGGSRGLLGAVFLACSLGACAGRGLTEGATWAARVGNDYTVVADIAYLGPERPDARLDAYTPHHVSGPTPTLVYFHGGGWTSRSRGSSSLDFLPYLDLGFAVVNVDYRIAWSARAPAAVEDCLCALRWVVANAVDYNFDPGRIVVAGRSAGGHLALITAMLPDSTGLGGQCRSLPPAHVAAVVNWSGITDVADILDGPNRRNFAVQWLGEREDRTEITGLVSPIRYVRPGLPPVLTIHGDADQLVPYEQAVRLHRSLDAAGVPNRLFTLAGVGHSDFEDADILRCYRAIEAFLVEHGILP